MKRIVQNQVKCTKCGDTPFSAHRHDFKYCQCGSVAVDGGMEYLRRVGDFANAEEMSMSMDESAIADIVQAVKWADEAGRNELGVALAVLRALRDNELLDMEKFS